MNIFEIIGAILLIVLAVLLVLLVMFQSPKGDGLSCLAGGSDSYFGRNSDRTIDAVLARYTKYAFIAFVVLTIVVYAVGVYIQ